MERGDCGLATAVYYEGGGGEFRKLIQHLGELLLGRVPMRNLRGEDLDGVGGLEEVEEVELQRRLR